MSPSAPGSRRVAAVLASLLLVACRPGASPNYDTDGDGHFDMEDCGPDDPLVFPGAPDLCGDGVDQDCDGQDGQDGDGDGYPAEGSDVGDCEADCNDNDDRVHPGAEEIPNDDVDNDCDGEQVVDQDGDGSPAGIDCDDEDPTLEELDLDGDDFSTCEGDCDDTDPALTPADGDGDGSTACDVPPDCDDTNAAAWPGAPELCDGIDNSCQGLDPDELDLDGDGFMLCNGECDDAEPTTFPGAWEGGFDGVDSSCDGVDGLDVPAWGVRLFGVGGQALAWLPDLDGDGLDELLIGDEGPWGYVFMFLGSTLRGADELESWQAHASLESWSNAMYSYLGGSVTAVGDIDGDGLSEIVVGTPQYSAGPAPDGPALGRAWLVLGSTLLAGGEHDVTGSALEIHPGGENAVEVGQSVTALGDIDGGGLPDFAIGAGDADEASRSGAWIFLGETVGPLLGPEPISRGLSQADLSVVATSADLDLGCGARIQPVGDLDGDGRVEIALGCSRQATDDSPPMVALIPSGDLVSGASFDLLAAPIRVVLDSMPATWIDLPVVEFDAVGDVDGDGLPELAIAQQVSGGGDRVDLFAGQALAAGGQLGTADAFVTLMATDPPSSSDGSNSDLAFGRGVRWVGDLDADGADELAVIDKRGSLVTVFSGAVLQGGGPLFADGEGVGYGFVNATDPYGMMELATASAGAGGLGGRDLVLSDRYPGMAANPGAVYVLFNPWP